MEEIKFLVVEDDFAQALLIKELLLNHGYTNVDLADNGKEAISLFENRFHDLVIMDVRLNGQLDGIQTVTRLEQIYSSSVIYITSLNDKETFARAKMTFPEFFLSKPFNEYQLLDLIETVIEKSKAKPQSHEFYKKYFFLKSSTNQLYQKYIKSDIVYLEAESSYTNLVLGDKIVLISKNLKQCLKEIDCESLIRISRSVAVNLDKIESIENNNSIYLTNKKGFKISKGFREQVLQFINRI